MRFTLDCSLHCRTYPALLLFCLLRFPQFPRSSPTSRNANRFPGGTEPCHPRRCGGGSSSWTRTRQSRRFCSLRVTPWPVWDGFEGKRNRKPHKKWGPLKRHTQVMKQKHIWVYCRVRPALEFDASLCIPRYSTGTLTSTKACFLLSLPNQLPAKNFLLSHYSSLLPAPPL